MSEMIRELGTAAMKEALEANFSEEVASFGRGLPGGEVHQDQELFWFFTGHPSLNGVLMTRFAQDDNAYIAARIAETASYFTSRQVSFGWAVGPSTQPANLGAHLEAQGFKQEGQTTGLAIDLLAIHEDVAASTELVISEISDSSGLEAQRAIEMKGFGSSLEGAQRYYDKYMHIGFGTSTPWHHYLGWLHGEPVAIASLLLYAGVAGVYGVATIPEARRQGIGAAMTLHALHVARALGYRIAVLSPTEMSLQIYRRLGFQEYCTIRHYGYEV
jgi:GNAT superfamily N-acetyltransferase